MPEEQVDTAYPETLAALAARVGKAELSEDDRGRPLTVCDPGSCLGMCCYDGVYLSDEEAAVVTAIADRARGRLEALGASLPEEVVVTGTWDGETGPKTATRPRSFSSLLADYPQHFEDTACVFLADDGRCTLQALAEEEGRHPWAYKPTPCWMHPLRVQGPQNAGQLTVPTKEDDPDAVSVDYPGYTSWTRCGSGGEGAMPAADALRDEIDHLRSIGPDDERAREDPAQA